MQHLLPKSCVLICPNAYLPLICWNWIGLVITANQLLKWHNSLQTSYKYNWKEMHTKEMSDGLYWNYGVLVQWLGCWLHDWGIVIRFLSGVTGFFLSQNAQTGFGVQPASVGAVDYTPGDGATREWSWPHTSMPKWRMNGIIPPLPHTSSWQAQWQLLLIKKSGTENFKWHYFEIL